MTYFREYEPEGGPYFDINNNSIPNDKADHYYRDGNMNPSSIKDYESNQKEIKKVTKRLVNMLKSVRGVDGNANF
jgi:hypothetical protein